MKKKYESRNPIMRISVELEKEIRKLKIAYPTKSYVEISKMLAERIKSNYKPKL